MLAKILIVDDDPGICETLKDILEANNYRADIALNGEKAIALCQQNRYDLALVDIKLPDISGPEVVKKIGGISPETDFIYITAYASVDSAIEGMKQARVVSYEIKPLDLDHVLTTIKSVIKHK